MGARKGGLFSQLVSQGVHYIPVVGLNPFKLHITIMATQQVQKVAQESVRGNDAGQIKGRWGIQRAGGGAKKYDYRPNRRAP